MELFRRLERRLESLMDGVIGGVFRGTLHPAELAGKIAREADLGSVNHDGVVVAPNSFVISINPADVDGTQPPRQLVKELQRTTEELCVDRGWRFEGPATVAIRLDDSAPHGNPRCEAAVVPGRRPPWAALNGPGGAEISTNHAVVGRASDADVTLDSPRVSRRHARLWREGERVMLVDLGSSNGTAVDGVPVTDRPVELSLPCVLTLGDVVYRLDPR